MTGSENRAPRPRKVQCLAQSRRPTRASIPGGRHSPPAPWGNRSMNRSAGNPRTHAPPPNALGSLRRLPLAPGRFYDRESRGPEGDLPQGLYQRPPLPSDSTTSSSTRPQNSRDPRGPGRKEQAFPGQGPATARHEPDTSRGELQPNSFLKLQQPTGSRPLFRRPRLRAV